MSQNISLEEIKKFWPEDAPDIHNVQKYVSKYVKEKIVIKYGGNVLIDRGVFNNFILDINILNKLGLSVIIVHGGGPRIKRELDQKKIESKFIDGLRVTDKNIINIGTAGGMTRLSTGYTFLNIQQQSRYIVNNLGDITNKKGFKIPAKYDFLDQVFLKVLKKYPKKMPDIFFNMFKSNSKNIINFLSNKSNFFEDMSIILRMPKMIFLKALFEK